MKKGGSWTRPFGLRCGALYSAAALVSVMNCETHFFRRFRFSRYIASISAGGKECTLGRAISASCHALTSGNFSITPSGRTRSRKA